MQPQPTRKPTSTGGKIRNQNGDRRRTLRIKRSGLKKNELQEVDRPTIKFAENQEELIRSFSLVYQVYLQKGFITTPRPCQMLYNIYSLLPRSTHIVAKSYLDVISNLSIIFDTPKFGLPLDVIYQKEVDKLRDQGRSVMELSALATPREHRWLNFFHYLVQVMYWYVYFRGVDDICIVVNPRHVRYYKGLFPFQNIGPERHYSRVGAPGVGLWVTVEAARESIVKIGENLKFETPFDYYFDLITGDSAKIDSSVEVDPAAESSKFDAATVRYFIDQDPGIVAELTSEQKNALSTWYPGLELG